VIIYYPISLDQWLGGFERAEKWFLPYCLFGEKQAVQSQLNMQWALNARKEHPEQYVDEQKVKVHKTSQKDLKIEAVQKPQFDFIPNALIEESVELPPLIFSHGCAADSFMYSRHLLELASHGYAVFGIQHNDQSCNYTEKQDGSPVYYDRTIQENDVLHRRR